MLNIGEPLAAQACVIRSVCGRSAYKLRSCWRGQANASRNRRLDPLFGAWRSWQCRFVDRCVFACGTDTQTAILVFAVEFRVRNFCDLAANEQHTERYQCQGRRLSMSRGSVTDSAHLAVFSVFLNVITYQFILAVNCLRIHSNSRVCSVRSQGKKDFVEDQFATTWPSERLYI